MNKTHWPGILKLFCLCWLAGLLSQDCAIAQSRQAVALVVRAERAFNARQYVRAIEYCERAIAISPNYVRAHSWLGTAHRRRYLVLIRESQQSVQAQKHRQAALEAYRKVLQLQPNGADANVARKGIRDLTIAVPPPSPPLPPPSHWTEIRGSKLRVDGQPVPLLFSLVTSRFGQRFLSVRDVAQTFGFEIAYNAEKFSLELLKEDTRIELRVHYYQAIVNGAELQLDQPPILFKERAYLPFEALDAIFRAAYGWDSKTLTLNIRKDGAIQEENEEEPATSAPAPSAPLVQYDTYTELPRAQVRVNDKTFRLKEPLLVSPEGHLLLTPEDIFGALQAKFEVDKSASPTISANAGDIRLWLRVDSTIGSVNGIPLATSLEQTPVLWKRKVYVPVDFVVQALGAQHTWNEADGMLQIHMKFKK